MARVTDLTGMWTLQGFLPWDGARVYGPIQMPCDQMPLPKDGGWQAGEWMARRHFCWSRSFVLPQEPREGKSERYYLHVRCQGAGEILLDGQNIGTVCGPWQVHVFDVTSLVEDEGEHHIALWVRDQPWARELPAFAIDEIFIRSVAFGRILSLQAKGDDGAIHIHQQVEGYSAGRVTFHYRVLLGDELITSVDMNERLIAAKQAFDHQIPIENPAIWHPNGRGNQPLYTVRLIMERGGTRCDEVSFTTGFSTLAMGPVPGAPGALPYALMDDGEQLLIQGVNAPHALSTAQMITLAKAGVNMIRFCGAMPPSSQTLDDCARLGLAIWQQLPLHSLPCANDHAQAISKDAAMRVATNPAAALLSAGESLLWPDGTPAGLLHPTISAMQAAAHGECASLTFFPTSPSGPVHTPTPLDVGRGLRHDVHGPLAFETETFAEDVNQTDALLLSRIGLPSGEDAVQQFIAAQWLSYLASAVRRKTPRCAGLLLWQAGATRDNLWQNSYALTDVGGSATPALASIAHAWEPVTASAAIEKPYILRGETLTAQVQLHAPTDDETMYTVTACLTDMRGNVLEEKQFRSKGVLGGRCGEIDLRLQADAPECLLLILSILDGDNEIWRNCLAIPVPTEEEDPMAPLSRLPKAAPILTQDGSTVRIANDNADALLGLCLRSGQEVIYYGCIMPWEKREFTLHDELIDGPVTMEAFNIQK